MTAVIHIAGPDLTIGQHLRQRCGWCGAVLIDVGLGFFAVPVGTDPRPAVWPIGGLVAVAGTMSYTVEHVDGEQLPSNACGALDPAVTL